MTTQIQTLDAEGSVVAFSESRCEQQPDSDEGDTWTVNGQMMYEAYVAWCGRVGLTPLSNPQMAVSMELLGFEKARRSDARFWAGVTLRVGEEDSDAARWNDFLSSGRAVRLRSDEAIPPSLRISATRLLHHLIDQSCARHGFDLIESTVRLAAGQDHSRQWSERALMDARRVLWDRRWPSPARTAEVDELQEPTQLVITWRDG